MRSLYECLYNYIFEAKLSNKDFDKHGYAYVRALINKLINNHKYNHNLYTFTICNISYE